MSAVQASAARSGTGGTTAPSAAEAEPQAGAGEGQEGAPARADVESISEGPLSFRVRSIAMLGARLRFAGLAHGLAVGEAVLLEGSATPGGPWSTLARARVDADGRFHAGWRAQLPGRLYLRARPARAQSVPASVPASGAEVTVYRPAIATIYGPGFYGQRTACGQRMSRALIGVANRSLPCGTLLELTYGGRTLTVPVVDRGPYAHGASFDLTARAATLLGATSTVRIGVLALSTMLAPAPSAPAAPQGTPAGGTSP